MSGLDPNYLNILIQTQTSYKDLGFDQFLSKLSVPQGFQNAADFSALTEGFSSGLLNIDVVRGAITVKDTEGIERVIIGNF